MKAFKVTGSFKMGRKSQNFSKEVIALDKKSANETILSELGSKHKVKRYDISIKEIVELKAEDVTDSIISHKLGVQ
ncbi:MAG: 50S ribosomal protein L18Ae [Thermoplasmata archaeon]